MSKFSRGAYRRPKTHQNIDLYTFLRAVRREIFWGYIGGIYRVESDFGGIYRVAVYIGSVAPKGPLRGIYRVYINLL